MLENYELVQKGFRILHPLMAGLLVESLQRLSGQGGEPVIQLKTAFGGGKTHSMLALYHMVRAGTLLSRIPGLKPIVDRAGFDKLPKANVAVLVGTALDPTRKKNPANLPKYTVSTIWGNGLPACHFRGQAGPLRHCERF